MSLIGGRIGYVDVTDDVGGHGTLPATSGRPGNLSQITAPPQLVNLEEGLRNGGRFGLISAGKSSAGVHHDRHTEHRGRIVKNTGDGCLAEFASVVDAVRCAAEVQRGMIEREPAVASAKLNG